jgi:hypothetical protein
MSFAKLLLAFALAVGSGCAARTATFGGGSTDGSPPPLAGRDVPMWDHYCAVLGGGRDAEGAFTALIDDASDNGWEMIGVTQAEASILLCFKRPRDVGPATPPVSTPPGEPAPTPPPSA